MFTAKTGVVINDNERAVWNTTFAIELSNLASNLAYTYSEEASSGAAIAADRAVEYLRAEMKKRDSNQ